MLSTIVISTSIAIDRVVEAEKGGGHGLQVEIDQEADDDNPDSDSNPDLEVVDINYLLFLYFHYYILYKINKINILNYNGGYK